jgi:hypothetical protein
VVLQKHQASSEEMMLYSNFFGGALGLMLIMWDGEFWEAIEFFSDKKWLYAALFTRSTVVYGWVWCISEMIRDFGVVVMTFVTTVRKGFSILLSFLLFPKPFTLIYHFAISIFRGAGLRIKLYYDYSKRQLRKDQFKLIQLQKGDMGNSLKHLFRCLQEEI